MEQKKYTLRGWQLSDAESLTKNANNINVWNNVRDYFPHPYSEEDAVTFINYASGKDIIEDFAIVIDGKAVGGAGFVPKTDVERISAEIGYWLGEPYWSKGIMTDVVKDIVDYVFTNTEIIRLFAPIFEYNHASMRVLEKAGFKKLTVLSNAAIKNGKIIDMHYFELIKDLK